MFLRRTGTQECYFHLYDGERHYGEKKRRQCLKETHDNPQGAEKQEEAASMTWTHTGERLINDFDAQTEPSSRFLLARILVLGLVRVFMLSPTPTPR